MTATAEYLEATARRALTDGLVATARVQPEDPVDFLGRYLLHYADSLDAATAAAAGKEAEAALAAAAAAAAAEAAAAAAAAAAVSPATRATEGTPGILSLLEGATEVDASTMTALASRLAELTGATGVYIAERMGVPSMGEEGGEAEEGGASSATVRYLAVSSGSEHVLGARISEADGGVTWPCWVAPPVPELEEEEEEEGEGEEGEEGGVRAKRAPPPPPELPVVHIRNVLREPKIVFHGVPRPGSYFVAPLTYGTPLHADAVPPPAEGGGEVGEGASAAEDAGAEGGEDGAEAAAAPATDGGEGVATGDEAVAAAAAVPPTPSAPAPNTIPRYLAICADTLGKLEHEREFTAEQVALLKAAAGALKGALQRTELAAYEAEYFSSLKPRSAEVEAADAAAERDASEALAKEAEDAATAALTAAGDLESPPDDIAALAKANVMLRAAQAAIGVHRDALLALASRRVPPRDSVQKALQATLLFFGKTEAQLGDAGAPVPTAFAWPVARAFVNNALADSLVGTSFDPAAPPAPDAPRVFAYARVDALRTMLEGLPSGEEVAGKEGPLGAALVAWIKAALDVKELAGAQRKRLEEEAAAKKLADAEAAAEAAAAAAEAVGEEGEGGEAEEETN